MSQSLPVQKQSRSLLVVLGGLLAMAGLGTGVLISVPGLHDAMTISDSPLDMTWHELVQSDWTDNVRVRLIDVQLSKPDSRNTAEQDIAEQDTAEQDIAEQSGESDFELLAYTLTESPIMVIPVGSDIDSVPAKVFVQPSAQAIEVAADETKSQGTLTGRFRRIRASGLSESDDGGFHYFFEPIGNVLSRDLAMEWFAMSFAAIAIGLVICGAGGPSFLCCIFFSGPAILSLLGYPLRYGRSRRLTKIAYALAGVALIANGYRQLVIEGHIGQLEGNVFTCVLGFLQMSIGTSSLLGAIASTMNRKAKASRETKPLSSKESATAKNSAQTKLTYSQACGMERCDAVSICDYVESQGIRINAGKISPDTNKISQKLSSHGFGDAQLIQWKDSKVIRVSVLQIGCQDVVVSEITQDGEHSWPRMISVLQDGLAVITLPPGFGGTAAKRLGTAGFYGVSPSHDIEVMMKTHLENTINMAETRNTTLVTFESGDAAHVSQLANRVFASVQTQYGEAHLKVGDASYGRFRFPAAPVSVLESVGS